MIHSGTTYLPNWTHGSFCDCFECTALPEHKILAQQIDSVDALNQGLDGKFVHITKPLTIYTAPDGKKVRRIAQPGKYVGKVQNITGGWITLNNNLGYIRFSNDLIFVKPDPNAPPLSKAQLVDVETGILEQMPGGEVVTAGKAIETAGEKLASIDWIGDLKYIAIGIIVVLVLILAIKLS
jgi:hypothetical protein